MLTVLASSGGALSANDLLVVTALVILVLAIGGVVFSAVSRRRQAAARLRQGLSMTPGGRLERLARSLRVSGRQFEGVLADVEAWVAEVREREEKARTAEALAALTEDQAEAVRGMIYAELATSRRDIRRDSIKIGVASFVAGAAVSLLVTLLVHPIH